MVVKYFCSVSAENEIGVGEAATTLTPVKTEKRKTEIEETIISTEHGIFLSIPQNVKNSFFSRK